LHNKGGFGLLFCATGYSAQKCGWRLIAQNLIIIAASIRLVGIIGRIVGVHHIAPVIIWGTVW